MLGNTGGPIGSQLTAQSQQQVSHVAVVAQQVEAERANILDQLKAQRRAAQQLAFLEARDPK